MGEYITQIFDKTEKNPIDLIVDEPLSRNFIESIDLTVDEPSSTSDIESIDLTIDETSKFDEDFIDFTFQPSILDQSLQNSLFNSSNPKPLIVYINEKDTIATDLFNQIIYSSDTISMCLAEQFLMWEWNLTDENFDELLSMVTTSLGKEIAELIVSKSKDSYPLFMCLIFEQEQIKINGLIENWMCENEIVLSLESTIDAMNNPFNLPDTTDLHLTKISKENWSIAESRLIPIENNSDEFRRVADDFDRAQSSIVNIHRIENFLWLTEYFKQKNRVDKRLGHDATEKLLFHGCPYHAAEQILRQGFDHQRIGHNGSSYGQGFYFSSRQATSNQYALPNPLTREKRILMCRVLVGENGLGHSSTTTCPTNLDSTGNRSDIFVVYSNRHVLPEYLITYK